MSYTRSYRGNLTIRGTTSFAYPASEAGGIATVEYTQEVPIDVDITVDTIPFDNSVGKAGNRIDLLTGAVAAMNTAQVASVKSAAEKVSNSLTNGFYNLIQHDVTSKQAESQSLLQSKVGILLEDSKALKSAHERMERDLERLKAHYGAIFKGLDEDLDKRIKELDRPSFRLGRDGRDDVVYDPYIKLTAETADALEQNARNSGFIAIARLKRNLSGVISLMSDSVHKSLGYKEKIKSILWQDPDNDSPQNYMPVAYSVTNDPMNGYGFINCVAGTPVRTQPVLSSVYSYVAAAGPQAGRPVDGDEKNLIDQAFSGLVETQSRSAAPGDEYQQRVLAVVTRMWQQDQQRLRKL